MPSGASQEALVVKNPPVYAIDLSSIAWRRAGQPTPVFLPAESLRTEEPGGLQSIRSQRVRHDCSDLACMQCFQVQVQ